MSLILEALKKIETDKFRNAQKADIAAAILQPDRRANRRKFLVISLLFLAAVLLLGAGAGISYLLSAKDRPLAASAPAQQNLPSNPVSPSPDGSERATTAAMERPAEVSLELLKPVLPEKRQPAETKFPLATNARAKREEPRDSEIVRPVHPPSTPKPSRSLSPKASVPEEDPLIKVSGIIWAEESGERRALVNGSSVKEGDIVEGARVERIELHNIRFSRNGKPFNLPIR